MFRKYVKGRLRVPEGGFAPKFDIPPAGVPRLCLVDGKPATFHRWVDEDKGLLRINTFTRPQEQDALHRRFLDDGVVPSCCSVEKLRVVFALVEYSDGSVGKVKPELIQFIDRGDVD